MCRTRRESAQGLVGKSARVLSKKYTLCVCHTSLAVPKAMFGIRLELVSIPKVSFWTLVKGFFPKVDFWDRFWDWTQSFARHNSCSGGRGRRICGARTKRISMRIKRSWIVRRGRRM